MALRPSSVRSFVPHSHVFGILRSSADALCPMQLAWYSALRARARAPFFEPEGMVEGEGGFRSMVGPVRRSRHSIRPV
jgi:hypothetical protein